MTILAIRQFGDPVLKDRARPVEVFDEALLKLRKDMMETMYDAPGVGLAAPQVGVSLRFFVFDDGAGSTSSVGAVANPLLTVLDGEQLEEEGCLSVPGVWYPTRRAMHVRVEGLDELGRPITIEGSELRARIFQHEADHLDGLLYLDRLDGGDRRKALAMLRESELTGRGGRSSRNPTGS